MDEVSGCASRVEYDPSLSDDFFPDDVSVEESSEVIQSNFVMLMPVGRRAGGCAGDECLVHENGDY